MHSRQRHHPVVVVVQNRCHASHNNSRQAVCTFQRQAFCARCQLYLHSNTNDRSPAATGGSASSPGELCLTYYITRHVFSNLPNKTFWLMKILALTRRLIRSARSSSSFEMQISCQLKLMEKWQSPWALEGLYLSNNGHMYFTSVSRVKFEVACLCMRWTLFLNR